MDMLQNLADDQLALLGCAGALAAAFTVMAVSFHVGRLVRGEQRGVVPHARSIALKSEPAAPAIERRAA